MGKSPGKWIKSVLFGKKTSNSSVSKRRDIPKKSSYEKAPLAPYQATVSNVVVQPCFISEPVLVTGAAGYANSELESVRTEILAVSNAEPTLCSPKEDGDARYANNELESGRTEIIAVSNAEPTLSSPKQDGDATATLNHDVPDDSEKCRIEQAATKAQAIFRGCRARRAFRTLKGIIRLQAVIRGHLVRRQAVATLNCMLGIVKFQALVRGRIIRRLDLGSQIHAKQTLSKQDAGFLDSITVYSCGQRDKLKKNAFACQLLSFASSAMPLHLPYDPEDPNSAWNWLLRWTMSHIWGTLLQRGMFMESKSKVESQSPVSKLSRPRKRPVNVDKASAPSASESGKVKRNSRPNEIDKTEYNTKKVSNSTSAMRHQAEVDTDKRRSRHRKSNSPLPETAENRPKNSSNKATNGLQGVAPDPVSQENRMMQAVGEDQDSKEHLLDKENHKISKRRASLPAKHDDQETLQHGTKVPSYMAATKSAKAKVRGQASPMFGQEEVEKNGPARRYSLPSSINAKPTSSPRVQRLVQSSGKGGIRIDRSLSSSRDSNEKMVHREWKR
ncbi:hypothetical protein Leryth_009950 [Lithospermum erythrorhizon]|nr:hypothetical protein Leryth_009950 [Lithospermum erythrorhizon]